MLKVTILCSDPRHPVNEALKAWSLEVAAVAEVRIVSTIADAMAGDFLFLVSCQEVVRLDARRRFRYALVLHASALPECRGMSPHVWQILDGRTDLTMSLLNADDPVDSGDVWRKIPFHVPRTAVFHEINTALFSAQTQLMSWAIANCDRTRPVAQQGAPTYCRRRRPADSEIDPQRPLAENFDLLRVADPERYPAHFTLHGRKFRITIDPIP
jgi:methionyl-tRNA formyltransferase